MQPQQSTRPVAPTRARLVWGALIVWCVCGLVLGCNRNPSAVDVTGSITFQGQPVASGLINFQASGQRPLGGGIGADGSYRFELPIGTYQVRIDTPPQLPEGWKEGDPPPKLGPRQVPPKYGNFATSGLTLEVTGAENPQVADFALP